MKKQEKLGENLVSRFYTIEEAGISYTFSFCFETNPFPTHFEETAFFEQIDSVFQEKIAAFAFDMEQHILCVRELFKDFEEKRLKVSFEGDNRSVSVLFVNKELKNFTYTSIFSYDTPATLEEEKSKMHVIYFIYEDGQIIFTPIIPSLFQSKIFLEKVKKVFDGAFPLLTRLEHLSKQKGNACVRLVKEGTKSSINGED